MGVKKEEERKREEPLWVRVLEGKSYKARNVCKSLIRSLYSYIESNKEEVVRVLTKVHFNMKAIETSFAKIGKYNEKEREKIGKKQSQAIIRRMLVRKSILTYILRDTLSGLLLKWRVGDYGKISRANIILYRDACECFYERAEWLINQPK